MRIDLAGKVGKDCWRHRAVPGLSGVLEELNGGTCPSGLGPGDLDRSATL